MAYSKKKKRYKLNKGKKVRKAQDGLTDVVDVVTETKTSSTAFPEVLVKWNAPHESSNVATGGHAYMVGTGL